MAAPQQKTTYSAAGVAALEETILKLKMENNELRRKLEHMNEVFANTQRARFGQSSEKNTYVLHDQASFFNEAEKEQNSKAVEATPEDTQQIMAETGPKCASNQAYLRDSASNADLGRISQERISACERLKQGMDSPDAGVYLWDAIVAYAEYSFTTEKGLSMKYIVKGGEIFFNRKEKSVTRASVMKAFSRARQLQREKGFVNGPKELGTFGASYVYPIFLRLGVCEKEIKK